MFRRIVCATDFSETAAAAARYAVSIARAFQGQVELVHAWHLPAELADGTVSLSPDLVADSRRSAEEELAEAARALGEGTTSRLLEGPPDQAIALHAAKVDADLVVTGTRGRTGVAHVLLGSVAERVVRTSSVPVLTVPSHTSVAADATFAPKSVLVPVDLGVGSAEMLRTAVGLAKRSQGRVAAAYAWQMPFYFAAGSELAADAERRETERFERWVSETLGGAESVVRVARNGSPGEVIAEIAAEQKAELVVMATAGRTGVEHFLLGSVTERTLRTIGRPVLTFRRPPAPSAS
jgi:nucleotide-binding universal stress UspA family protein